MKKLQEDLEDPEKLRAMREAVDQGKQAWEQKTGKKWTTKDPIDWIKAWKEGDSYGREFQTCF